MLHVAYLKHLFYPILKLESRVYPLGYPGYYLKNAHGDTVKTVSDNERGRNYDYDEYGVTIDTDKNPFGYSGEYTDSESGLQYLRARYYNPSIKRFMSEDSYKGELTNPLSLIIMLTVKVTLLIELTQVDIKITCILQVQIIQLKMIRDSGIF